MASTYLNIPESVFDVDLSEVHDQSLVDTTPEFKPPMKLSVTAMAAQGGVKGLELKKQLKLGAMMYCGWYADNKFDDVLLVAVEQDYSKDAYVVLIKHKASGMTTKWLVSTYTYNEIIAGLQNGHPMFTEKPKAPPPPKDHPPGTLVPWEHYDVEWPFLEGYGCHFCAYYQAVLSNTSYHCAGGGQGKVNWSCDYRTYAGAVFGDDDGFQTAYTAWKKEKAELQAQMNKVKYYRNSNRQWVLEGELPQLLADQLRYNNDHSGITQNGHGGHEQQMGESLGLQLFDLSSACADFYVLEDLHNQLWGWNGIGGDANDQESRRKNIEVREQFRGTHMEVLATAVHRDLQCKVDYLAEQFSTYINIACGGELRHGLQLYMKDRWVKNCLHTEHKKDCCAHGKAHTFYFCGYDSTYGQNADFTEPVCGCKCHHRHTTKCKLKLKGCAVEGCCGHKCSTESGCITKGVQTLHTERIERYRKRWSNGGGSRVSGWRDWHELSKRNPARWLQDCADHFNGDAWGGEGGVGGPRWGLAANIGAAYLRGEMTKRTFIDRCWSLQHNGGCLFNKFWAEFQLEATNGGYVELHGHSPRRLDFVLAVQASGNYDLLARFAHEGPRHLRSEFLSRKARLETKNQFVESMVERSLRLWRERQAANA